MPNMRNFDITFGKSITCAVRASGVQSVENVSGKKPACKYAFGHVPAKMAGAPVAQIELDAAPPGGHHLQGEYVRRHR